MKTIAIATEIPGRENPDAAIEVQVADGSTTVRQLIDLKIRSEIAAWRKQKRERFGLEYGEWNVDRKERRTVKEEAEVAKAIEAFAAGRFFVFVDGMQIGDPDGEFAVTPSTRIRFVRLVPLVGG